VGGTSGVHGWCDKSLVYRLHVFCFYGWVYRACVGAFKASNFFSVTGVSRLSVCATHFTPSQHHNADIIVLSVLVFKLLIVRLNDQVALARSFLGTWAALVSHAFGQC
jgi:hypothetical protein